MITLKRNKGSALTHDELDDNFEGSVNLFDAQTINGIKTFASSPVVPTPIAGDNSTKVATTAYVNSAVDNVVRIFRVGSPVLAHYHTIVMKQSHINTLLSGINVSIESDNINGHTHIVEFSLIINKIYEHIINVVGITSNTTDGHVCTAIEFNERFYKKILNTQISFTVSPTGDFNDIQTCLYECSRYSPIDGGKILVYVDSSYVFDKQIIIEDVNLSHVTINPLVSSFDFNIMIDGNSSTTRYFNGLIPIFYFKNCHTPIIQQFSFVYNGTTDFCGPSTNFCPYYLENSNGLVQQSINDIVKCGVFCDNSYIKLINVSVRDTFQTTGGYESNIIGINNSIIDVIYNQEGPFNGITYGSEFTTSNRVGKLFYSINSKINIYDPTLLQYTDGQSDWTYAIVVEQGGTITINYDPANVVATPHLFNITPNTLSSNGIIFTI